MSVMLLGKENYQYLKEMIIRYMGTNSHIKYNLIELKEKNQFDDLYVEEFINKKIDLLAEENIISYELRYKEKITDVQYKELLKTKNIKFKNTYYPADELNIEELLQVNKIINCILYQIEQDFDDRFIKEIQRFILKDIADIYEEVMNLELAWGF